MKKVKIIILLFLLIIIKKIKIFFLYKYIYLILYNNIVIRLNNYKIIFDQVLNTIYLLLAALLIIFSLLNIFTFA